METVLELKIRLGKLWDEARAIDELAGVETRDLLTEDEEKRSNELIAQMDALQATIERREKLEGFTGVEKPQGSQRTHPTKTTPDTAQGIYCRFIRTGDEGAQRELNPAVIAEYRASNDTTMNITTAADGGDLVPVGHYQGIIERARPVALYDRLGLMTIPGIGTTVNVPVDNESDNGAFVSTAESATFDRDAPAVGKVAMTLVKYTKKVDLTYELLQDEDSALLTFLNSYVGKGFAATLNTLLVTEALADGTAGLTFDSATAIAAPEVPELLYKLSAEYAQGSNVAWLARRATEGFISGLFGTSQFSFGTQAGAKTGNGTSVSSSLWGIPFHSNDNMGALAASGKSLIIGDWSNMAYRLDPTMTVLRDPYSRAGNGEIILHYYFRADFEVLQASSLQYGTHPSA